MVYFPFKTSHGTVAKKNREKKHNVETLTLIKMVMA